MRYVFAVLTFISSLAFAVTDGPQSITLDGVLYSEGDFTSPLLDVAASLKIQILDPSKTCVLYEETQVVNTLSTSGKFNIQLGSAIGSVKRSGDDPARSMTDLLQNVSDIAATNAGCPGSVYSPSTGDVRYIRIEMTPSVSGVASVMTPDMTISNIPNALVCESVQGLDRSKLLELGTSVHANMTQANFLKLINASDVGNLHNHDGVYAQLNSSNSISLGDEKTVGFGQFTSAQETTLTGTLNGTSDVGKTWVNSDTGKVMYWDGAAAVDLSAGGAGAVTSVFSRTGVVVAVSGDYAAGQVTNVAAGNISGVTVQAAIDELDSEKLALAGGTMSGVINMNSNKITNLTDATLNQDAATLANVNAAIVANNGSFVAKAGDTMGGPLNIDNANELRLHDDAGAEYVSLKSPNGLAGNVNLTLPPNDGNSGDLLRTDGAGVMSWVPPGSASGVGDILDGGNTTGAAVTIGTNDTFDFNLESDGVIRMTIDSGGNIGIGTAAPGTDLHIVSSSGRAFKVETVNDFTAEFISTDATSQIVIGDNTSTADGNRVAVTGDEMKLFTAGSERLRIDASGNVGIGTATPAQKLHVAGNARVDGSFISSADGFSSSLGAGSLDLVSTNATASQIVFTERFAAVRGALGFAAGSGDLTYRSGGNSMAAGIERFRITSTGNIGIGTAAPNAKLTVEGTMTLDQVADPTGTAGYGSIYAKSDGDLYYRDGTGAITNLSGGAGGGDITSVIAGAGLINGATTGAATVDVAGGDGIVANANDIAVDFTVDKGLHIVSNKLEVEAGTGIVLSSSGVNVDVGVSNGKIIQADATGLPVIDGSQVTGVVGRIAPQIPLQSSVD